MTGNTFGSLRPVGDDDLQLMLLWRNAPAIRDNMYTRHEISEEEHLRWWSRTKSSEAHRYLMYEWDSEPLGVVGFNNIDNTNQNASWAFYAAPEAKKGTGSRMEFLALDYVFNELKLNKLYCEVLDFNTSVIRLHQKFGFTVEGIFRQQHRRDEAFCDIYRLGILATEWEAIRPSLQAKLQQPKGE